MSITFQCHCGQAYSVDESLAGKQAQCHKCKQTFTIPAQSQAAAAGPAVENTGGLPPSPPAGAMPAASPGVGGAAQAFAPKRKAEPSPLKNPVVLAAIGGGVVVLLLVLGGIGYVMFSGGDEPAPVASVDTTDTTTTVPDASSAAPVASVNPSPVAPSGQPHYPTVSPDELPKQQLPSGQPIETEEPLEIPDLQPLEVPGYVRGEDLGYEFKSSPSDAAKRYQQVTVHGVVKRVEKVGTQSLPILYAGDEASIKCSLAAGDPSRFKRGDVVLMNGKIVGFDGHYVLLTQGSVVTDPTPAKFNADSLAALYTRDAAEQKKLLASYAGRTIIVEGEVVVDQFGGQKENVIYLKGASGKQVACRINPDGYQPFEPGTRLRLRGAWEGPIAVPPGTNIPERIALVNCEVEEELAPPEDPDDPDNPDAKDKNSLVAQSKRAFENGYPQEGFGLLEAAVLAGDEEAKGRYRWSSELKRATLGLNWAIAIQLNSNIRRERDPEERERPREDEFAQSRSRREVLQERVSKFREGLGETGSELVRGLELRLTQGWFGDWSRSADEDAIRQAAEGDVKYLTVLEPGKRVDLLEQARKERVDVILAVVMSRGTGGWRMQLRIIDAFTGGTVKTSRSISGRQVAQAKEDGEASPALPVIEDMWAFVDSNLRVKDGPAPDKETVLERVEQLMREKYDNPLSPLAEIYHYYRVGLLDKDKARQAIDAVAGRGSGKLMLEGTDEQRTNFAARWAPRLPQELRDGGRF